jgi:magnesium-transporting ATPase (P-type)
MNRIIKFIIIYLFFYFILTFEIINPHNAFGSWGHILISLLISGFLYLIIEKLSKINGLGKPKSILLEILLFVLALTLIFLFIAIIAFAPFLLWRGDQT